MDALAIFIPLMPLSAALIIGIGHLCGALNGERSEDLTADIASWAISMSFLLALALLVADFLGKNSGFYNVGSWLNSDTLDIQLNFFSTGFNVRLAALFSILLALVIRFSIGYMHREAGFHRFFFLFCLFASAMLLLVLSGNVIGTLIGWELASLCSYFLIGYAYHRSVAVENATRIFITHRIGDAGFLLGSGLSYAWIGNLDWNTINLASEQLSLGEATSLAMCFTIAAFAKSAQLPFTPWLARAMEGPTPSTAIFYGAVMVHAGVYLIILLKPIFAHAPLAMAVLAIVGLLTALYSYIVGLTQTDVKSSLCFASSGQLGLMFLECGLGFWQLASWHLGAHAVVRCYQFLTAPSLMQNSRHLPALPPTRIPAWIYVASLQRLWLDPITDWALIKPIKGLAHDLSYFDDHIVDWFMGAPAPAIRAISSLAQLEEQKIGARLENQSDQFAQGSGLAGNLTQWSATILHWFEERFVLRGIGNDAINHGRRLGHLANMIEKSVLRPRYLVLFVFITLLVAF